MERWTWPFITQQILMSLSWVWLLWATWRMAQGEEKVSKNKVRYRVALDVDVRDATLLYQERCGAESFSKR